ncbi:diguanylate cyclase [Alishewanella sp. HH-ZS]|nr:diguanylate cyclase [Alishewanella sp. HH-ZS]
MADIEALNGETFELASNAYRSADNESLAWMRAEAASVLGQIALRTDGDYGRALSEEALRYFEAQQMHDMVANELYMSAFSWWKQRDSQSLKNAEQLFRRSAEAAQRADNPFGVAYAEAGLCGVLEQQGRVAEALLSCRASLPKLKGIRHITEYSTNVNYAAALLANKEPGQAMVILESLAKDWPEWDVGYHGYRYYFIRGQTYAALDHYEAAVSDLNVALSELLEFGDNSWARNNRLVQARFRVEQLAQSLERKTLEAAEKDRRHRLLVVSGVIVTLLLSVIVMMLLRHRRFYRRMAFTDPLTGLANRRYTEARAQEAFVHAKARQQPLFIALLDLDRFKTCNDRYGHDAGDEALKRFAYVASKILRPGDIFGRWGGEEFLLVLQGVDRDEANTILERLRSAAAAERLKLAPDYPLHFSAGVVGLQHDTEQLAELLTLADQALYQAKEAGRNRSYFAKDYAVLN